MDKTLIIALTTFRELARSKILYSVLFAAAILVAISGAFGTVTIGDQIKVIKDFGLAATSIFPISFAIISGSSLLSKELSKKTIYNILAKPVRRSQFVTGKFLGMLATALLMMCMLAIGLLLFLGFFEHTLDLSLLQAFCFSALEITLVCAITIFFSSIVVTPLLAGAFTLGVFLTGRSAEYIIYFVHEGAVSSRLSSVLRLLYQIIPHLDKLNVNDQIVYGNYPSIEYLAYCTLYTFGFSVFFISLAGISFKWKEFN